MKYICYIVFSAILLIANAANAANYGKYDIQWMTVNEPGHKWNSVRLSGLNVTNSPCNSTVSGNRFAIVSDMQYASLLAAQMNGRQVTLRTQGECNEVGLEKIFHVVTH